MKPGSISHAFNTINFCENHINGTNFFCVHERTIKKKGEMPKSDFDSLVEEINNLLPNLESY
jgi:hypothetical protein